MLREADIAEKFEVIRARVTFPNRDEMLDAYELLPETY
ncbi:MAG: hypothetical protein ACI909_001661 [Planctomycetota bacterium]